MQIYSFSGDIFIQCGYIHSVSGQNPPDITPPDKKPGQKAPRSNFVNDKTILP